MGRFFSIIFSFSQLQLEQSRDIIDNNNTPVREDRASVTDRLNYPIREEMRKFIIYLSDDR